MFTYLFRPDIMFSGKLTNDAFSGSLTCCIPASFVD
jgi:hypothetical protein